MLKVPSTTDGLFLSEEKEKNFCFNNSENWFLSSSRYDQGRASVVNVLLHVMTSLQRWSWQLFEIASRLAHFVNCHSFCPLFHKLLFVLSSGLVSMLGPDRKLFRWVCVYILCAFWKGISLIILQNCHGELNISYGGSRNDFWENAHFLNVTIFRYKLNNKHLQWVSLYD